MIDCTTLVSSPVLFLMVLTAVRVKKEHFTVVLGNSRADTYLVFGLQHQFSKSIFRIDTAPSDKFDLEF